MTLALEVCGSGIAIGLGSQARPVSIFSRQGLGHVVPSAGHGPTHTSSQVAALPAPRGAAPALHNVPIPLAQGSEDSPHSSAGVPSPR